MQKILFLSRSVGIGSMALMLFSCQISAPRVGMPEFATPLEGFQKMTTALHAGDMATVESTLGLRIDEIVTGDKVADRNDRDTFFARAGKDVRARNVDDNMVWIDCGSDNWTFPSSPGPLNMANPG